VIAKLDDAQVEALRAVCALYLAETRWALSAGCCAPPAAHAEVLQRRDACEAVIGGER
jgi:hypothetical protein